MVSRTPALSARFATSLRGSKTFFAFLLTLLSFHWATAQILDDSTKNVYGPTTTRYVLENDIVNNREIPYSIDTLIDGFHNYSFLNRNQNLYQDLANFGTAARPVFYQPPEKIGAMVGYNVYSIYAFDPETIKYYNTRSPFTSLYYVQGGNGIQLLDVEHSQNVKPNWNVGFRYRRPTAPPQYSGLSNPNNRQVDNHTVAIYSRYQNKDSTYQILGNFTHLNHQVKEQGSLVYLFQTDSAGYAKGEMIPLESLFSNIETQTVLNAALSQEKRNDWHIYQQYAPVAAFQLYYVLDRQKHINSFIDANLARSMSLLYPRPFYPEVRFTYDRTEQETKYLLIENKVGIKGTFTRGRLAGFNYRFHARRRDYSLRSKFPVYSIKRNENFVGGWLNYYFPDSSKFFVEAEYLLGADYRFRGEYQSQLVTAGYYRVASSPTLIQQQFFSNSYEWDLKDFKLVNSDNIYGTLHARLGGLTVQPSAMITNLKNYVYYDTAAISRQYSPNIQILRLGFGFEFRAGNFYTLNQAYYTKTSNANLIRIPEIFVNSRIAYQVLFKKVLYIQIGTELHYKSDYYADAYMPLTQQYHLQNDFNIPGYLIADVFADMRINRVRLFFKMSHVNQDLKITSQPSYFAAPVFPGLPRAFGFGVNWLMFD